MTLGAAGVFGYLLGRWTAPSAAEVATAVPPMAEVESSTSTPSTCPCPELSTPKPRRPIPRRRVEPEPPALAGSADGTEATGRALRNAARDLGRCGPPFGERRPLHLEVEVEPSGGVRAVRVLNVDALPPSEVVGCVRSALSELRLPAFDASDPARFSLSLSL